MLSILIPTYNYNVVSLVNQLHKQATQTNIHFEIIVVDDCSTNFSIVKHNKEIEKLENCQLLKNEYNIGRTASRNLLAEQARYDLLLFLDADVIPQYKDFIFRFNLNKNKHFPVVFGGVSYYKQKPEKNKILRWKYGKAREAKKLKDRLKEPYFIISQNLLINKNVFISANSVITNAYGLDILFSNNLKKNNVYVKHIDNPVFHLGLETSVSFMEKSLEAVATTLKLEENGLLDTDLRPLQRSYRRLKKWKLVGIFNILNTIFKTIIKLNLTSRNPSLFLFDIYRLHYYTNHKAKLND